jgi:hypothetical protein
VYALPGELEYLKPVGADQLLVMELPDGRVRKRHALVKMTGTSMPHARE